MVLLDGCDGVLMGLEDHSSTALELAESIRVELAGLECADLLEELPQVVVRDLLLVEVRNLESLLTIHRLSRDHDCLRCALAQRLRHLLLNHFLDDLHLTGRRSSMRKRLLRSAEPATSVAPVHEGSIPASRFSLEAIVSSDPVALAPVGSSTLESSASASSPESAASSVASATLLAVVLHDV